MRVLYLDVYFFVNFTVDILALYFACKLVHTTPRGPRLILSGIIGSGFAIIAVLFDVGAFGYAALLFLCVGALSFVSAKGISFLRRIKLGIYFLLIETLLGGIVSSFYNYLNLYIYPFFEGSEEQIENKRLLVLSLFVLIGFMLIKLLSSLFSGMVSERSARVSAEILGVRFEGEALVDNGNYLTDPMDNTAVTIIKAGALSPTLVGKSFSEIAELLEPKYKTKIRLIPTDSLGGEKILVGIRCTVKLKVKNKEECVNTVIAIDNEEGSFAGYPALIPAKLLY